MILLGYSMGARAALQHAVAHPDAWDMLILISPNPGIEDISERAARRATDAKLADRIEREGVVAFIEFWQQTPMIRSQKTIRLEWRAQMKNARAEHTDKGLANSLRQFGQGNYPNLWPALSKLSIPICLITGEKDYKYTDIVKRMISQLQNNDPSLLKSYVIDGAGHMPHLEAPEKTAEVIHQFMHTNSKLAR
jgi:2-succinyl-6-hydroxy-2,4-cyclohexadiene-1-carboxylate synthase